MKNRTPTNELLRMTVVELRREIAAHQIEYAKLRMGVEMQKEKNHALSKSKRRDIARMQTVLTQLSNGKSVDRVAKKTPENASAVLSEKSSQKAKKTVKVASSKSKKS